MNNKIFIGIFLFMLLGSCGSVKYTSYVLDYSNNKLRALDPVDDLPIDETCKPDENDKSKCWVMLREQYFAAKKELLELRQAVKDCQKSTP